MKQLIVAQVNSRDIGGGAAKMAYDLYRSFLTKGIDSWMLVGIKVSQDMQILRIIPSSSMQAADVVEKNIKPYIGKIPGIGRFKTLVVRALKNIDNFIPVALGHEPMYYPGSLKMLELLPRLPDILHFHNLHGSYFDLRSLPFLTSKIPSVLTLHDTWMLSGHCASFLDCNRWKTGCGNCPDLKRYPALKRDGTGYNWKRKHAIFKSSRLHLVAPSRWVANRVQESMLMGAAVTIRTIYNGIDLGIFKPGDKNKLREKLGISRQAFVVLFVADGAFNNIYKDYKTVELIVQKFVLSSSLPVVFICLGDYKKDYSVDGITVIFPGCLTNPREVAQFYQVADVYLHGTKAETFSLSTVEALACGVPVIANDVGALPEVVKPLREFACGKNYSSYEDDEATGILFSLGDVEQGCRALQFLSENNDIWQKLSYNAIQDVQKRFGKERFVAEYLDLYREIIDIKKLFNE